MLTDLTNSGAIPTLSAALRFASERQKLIAHNIANVETPNFIQRNVSVSEFQRALTEAVDNRRRQSGGESGDLHFGNSTSIRVDSDGGVELRPERAVPSSEGGVLFHDKNNRDLERLMQDSVENAAFYRMNIDLLRTRFDLIRSAIAQRP
ncbi:MAG: flagellar basal body rod protein FlgB [Phycisphaerales bacterium]